MKQEKKSILGLNTVKAFIVILLAVAIVAIVTLVVLGSLSTESFISQVGRADNAYVANETLTVVNETGQGLTTHSTENSITCSHFIVLNASSDTVIPSANYTTTGCTLAYSSVTADAWGYNNTNWEVSYLASWKDRDDIVGVTSNVSAGISNFFNNSSTYFALLGVVVIILIISLVVVVVNRFGGGGTEEISGGAAGSPMTEEGL